MVACKEVAWEIHRLKKLVTVENWVVEKVATDIQKMLLGVSPFVCFAGQAQELLPGRTMKESQWARRMKVSVAKLKDTFVAWSSAKSTKHILHSNPYSLHSQLKLVV